VLLVVVEVVVVEVVVVVGGTVVVVVVVVLVVVVVFVGARFASIKYDVPYQASGLPQHTPALNRYVPGSRFLDI
jgi:hypothetical protein